jgi:serine protease Do
MVANRQEGDVRLEHLADEPHVAEQGGIAGEINGLAVLHAHDEGGPAANAGLEVGDIVVSFDGQDVTAMRQLPKIVAQTAIDKEVEVVVLRKGERMTFRIKVGQLDEGGAEAAKPEPEGEKGGALDAPKKSSLGMTFSPITDELRSRYAIDRGVRGVIITEIDPEGPAADKEVQPGDVVVEISQQRVGTPEEVTTRLETLRKLKRRNALLTVADSGGEVSFVAVEIVAK